MKTLHISKLEKQPNFISYCIDAYDNDQLFFSKQQSIKFSKPVFIANSTVIDMFKSIFFNKNNQKVCNEWQLKIDIDEDIENLANFRKCYENVILMNGGGLDSNAFKILAKDTGCLKYATMLNLKTNEMQFVLKDEIDNLDTVAYTIENKISTIGNLTFDIFPRNFFYVTLLLVDHFKASHIVNAYNQKMRVPQNRYPTNVNIRVCGFLSSDINTAYVNAVYDKENFFNRLYECGTNNRFKSFRKLLYVLYLQNRLDIEILPKDYIVRYIEHNRIHLCTYGGIAKAYASEEKYHQMIYAKCLSGIGKDQLKKLFSSYDECVEIDKLYDTIGLEKLKPSDWPLFDKEKLFNEFPREIAEAILKKLQPLQQVI